MIVATGIENMRFRRNLRSLSPLRKANNLSRGIKFAGGTHDIFISISTDVTTKHISVHRPFKQ